MGGEDGRRRKKRKYEVIKGDWGDKVDETKDETNTSTVEKVEKVDEDDSLEHANVVTVCVENDEVEKLSDKAEVSKPIGTKKVWTKLNNGLFGWRKMPTVKRRCKQSTASPGGRQCTGSTSARNTSVSTSPTAAKETRKTKKLHSFFTAKEAKIDSCGTAPGCVVLDGLIISCGPGQVSDFESNTEIEFGRDLNNSVGVGRPRLSGVIRGQGK